MRLLMDHLGNPQDSYKVIHVAGTSGKTSTAYYIASILKQTGSKVGLTISPHVNSITERLQIDLEPLSEDLFVHSFLEFLELIRTLDFTPNYFEILVAFAYWEFARQKVDYAIVEVGMGGLIDGTNVVSRNDKVSVITDIGLDHQKVLGRTIEEIAYQKAGIILPNSKGFCLKQDDNVINVFKSFADNVKAKITVIEQDNHIEEEMKLTKDLQLYQQRNWFLASNVSDYVIERDRLKPLTNKQKEKAVNVFIPARMELIEYKDKTIILDAAHNPQKINALVKSLQQQQKGKKYIVILSLLNCDVTRAREILISLMPLTDKLVITNFRSRQVIDKHSLAKDKIYYVARKLGYLKIERLNNLEDIFKLIKRSNEEDFLITGSLYLINEIHYILNKQR